MYDFNCHQPLALAQTIDLIGRNEKALHGVSVVGDTIMVGATTWHANVAVDDSFRSLFDTALEENEINYVVWFSFPQRAGYAKPSLRKRRQACEPRRPQRALRRSGCSQRKRSWPLGLRWRH
jgi:hypothetical protein